MTTGQTYRLKLNGVSGKAKVKWKSSNKYVVSIAKRKGNAVTFMSKKKGTAMVTAVYKQKKYRCRVTVWEGKKKKPAAACRNLDEHGKTLVYADGRFYVIITGFNEPKPRPYMIYETDGDTLEALAEKNNFDLDFFRQ